MEERGDGHEPGDRSKWKLGSTTSTQGGPPAVGDPNFSTPPLLGENWTRLSFFGSQPPSQAVPSLKSALRYVKLHQSHS